MEDESLYTIVNCGNHTSCLWKVVAPGGGGALLQRMLRAEIDALQRGQTYQFLYRTSPTPIQNSSVVIKIRQTGSKPLPGSPVQLRRYALALRLRSSAVVLSGPRGLRISSATKLTRPRCRIRHVQDQFHRYGPTSAAEHRMLQTNLHTRYNNGQGCVSTLEDIRRAQFLFQDGRSIPGRPVAFLGRVSGTTAPGPATAAESEQIRQYERLKLVVSNYRKNLNAPGCFAFALQAGSASTLSLEFTMSDLERQVQATPWDTSKSWTFKLQ